MSHLCVFPLGPFGFPANHFKRQFIPDIFYKSCILTIEYLPTYSDKMSADSPDEDNAKYGMHSTKMWTREK